MSAPCTCTCSPVHWTLCYGRGCEKGHPLLRIFAPVSFAQHSKMSEGLICTTFSNHVEASRSMNCARCLGAWAHDKKRRHAQASRRRLATASSLIASSPLKRRAKATATRPSINRNVSVNGTPTTRQPVLMHTTHTFSST